MTRYLLGFLLIAGMAWGQTKDQTDKAMGEALLGLSQYIAQTDLELINKKDVVVSTSHGELSFKRRAGSGQEKSSPDIHIAGNGNMVSVGNGCETDRKHGRLDKARLEVMQKALAYIAKMAARNPKEEQDAGEFLEHMGRILAGSEGK